jgi:hypothetical protein
MPKIHEVKDNEIINPPATTDPWNVHRLFLEETARWRPGGYVDRESNAELPAAPTSGAAA